MDEIGAIGDVGSVGDAGPSRDTGPVQTASLGPANEPGGETASPARPRDNFKPTGEANQNETDENGSNLVNGVKNWAQPDVDGEGKKGDEAQKGGPQDADAKKDDQQRQPLNERNTLRRNNRGVDENVRQMQEVLKSKGYDIGESGADGRFGRNTEAAIRKFQKDQGIQVDGVAGRDTLGRLNGNNGPNNANGPDGRPTQGAQNTQNNRPLEGDDRKLADFLSNYVRQHGGRGVPPNIGDMMVQYGRQYNVDPRVLAAIGGQETNWGRTGIGANGMLGVGAYDANPRNAVNNSAFSGVENQIRRGAQTFDRLRGRFGSDADQPISSQTRAVNGNGNGWATDRNWYRGVNNIYNRILAAERNAAGQ